MIRQALGGARYSARSGIPNLVDTVSPNVTFEGDNTVMAIQSTNFLKKLHKKVMSGEKIVHPIFGYLNNMNANMTKVCQAKSANDFCDVDLVCEALEVNSCYLIATTL